MYPAYGKQVTALLGRQIVSVRSALREEKRAMPAYEKPPAWRVVFIVAPAAKTHREIPENALIFSRKRSIINMIILGWYILPPER